MKRKGKIPQNKKKRRRQAAAGLKIPIPVLDDVWEKQERFVVLFGHGAKDCFGQDLSGIKVIGWDPDKGEAGLIPSARPLMPPNFLPLDSCAGFVCGMHISCLTEQSEWKFRVAVSNPASKYQVELPLLDMTSLPVARRSMTETDFFAGQLQLKMTPPLHEGERFCVHVTTSCDGVDTIHSFNSILWRWESLSSFFGEPTGSKVVGDLLFRYRNVRSYDVGRRKWTAIAGPGEGKPWDAEFPVPERFAGSRYKRMFSFRYRDKVMAACSLSGSQFVLLEHGGECGGWKVVTSVDGWDFPSWTAGPVSYSQFYYRWVEVRGDLLVLPCDCYTRPVAFNLRNKVWMELPPELAESDLALNCLCVYEPSKSSSNSGLTT